MKILRKKEQTMTQFLIRKMEYKIVEIKKNEEENKEIKVKEIGNFFYISKQT